MATLDDKYNPSHSWNQNIIRNLKYKFPEALNSDLIDEVILLKRFHEWTGEICLSEDEDGFLDYLKNGE